MTVNRDEGWYTLYGEDFEMLRRRWALRGPKPPTSKLKTAAHITHRLAHAAASIAKTTLGIDRATEEQVDARFNVCRHCPGGHATFNADGSLPTCGPMLESLKRDGHGTCGCILTIKARDRAEACPFGWWPKAVEPGKTT